MFFHTFLFVFIAEMADKTQLTVMALMHRYRLKTVLWGMILGVIIISGLSVLAGDLIGDVIPMWVIKLSGAMMFIFFGFYNLVHKEEDNTTSNDKFRFPTISIALTFLLAELGDKTQLATVAIAADHMDAHLQVFLGASAGLILANIFGIFAGKFIFSCISENTIRVCSTFIFFFFGSINFFEVFPSSIQIIFIYSAMLILLAYFFYMHQEHKFSKS